MAAHREAWVFFWIVLLYLCPCITPTYAEEISVARPGCSDRCGNVTVPYPFGIHDFICSKNQSFFLNCSHATSYSSPTTLMLSGYPVTNVSVQDSTMVTNLHPSFDCYNGTEPGNHLSMSFNLTGTPFTISHTRNIFAAVGCDALSFISDPEISFGRACLSVCTEPQNFTKESSCSGVGCCESLLPQHVKAVEIDLTSTSNHTTFGNFSPCSYAFLVDRSTDSLDLPGFNLFSTTPQRELTRPMVLDWVFSSAPDCDEACASNADCIYSENGRGYTCKCKEGYRTTNPYLSQGCQDIDECKEPEKYPCYGRCKNTMGNYTCDCAFGMEGDGKYACQLAASVKITAGFFAGYTSALVIALILIIRARNNMNHERATQYMNTMFPLFSLFGFIVLLLAMYAINIYY